MKRAFLLSLLLGTSLLLTGCLPNQQTVEPAPTPATTQETVFTLEEVGQHNSATDCWLVVDGGVYDVTAYIASGRHPGGEEIVQGCGKDATALFESKPTSGQPHSSSARAGLEQMRIGALKK